MSRKDYRAVAEEIAAMLAQCTNDGRGDIRAEGIADTAKMLAMLFRLDNSRFDTQRLYYAAGLDENGRAQGRPKSARPINGS